ncbi:hypothetical protein TNCT_231641 [Trichonephila clavata]|uniref:Uncharacterized protein n=1 Tax=Trichonephila clavata TaxID=2740835 RepID=A0A8X6LKV1_TRICU|nr:hypothetical protein TNCT_231641 [Trichonephila clavata]
MVTKLFPESKTQRRLVVAKSQIESNRNFEVNPPGNPIGPIGFGQFREKEFSLLLVNFPRNFPLYEFFCQQVGRKLEEHWTRMGLLIFSRRQ